MNRKKIINKVCQAINKVREEKPLVEQITNYVTINDCANVTLAIGASPVMADGKYEVEGFTKISKSIVINFGIIDVQSLETIIKAGKTANENNIPIVFDPVGMGAIEYRDKGILELLENVHMSVIKGNAGEIMALAGEKGSTKGVDSLAESGDAIQSAIEIANRYRCICAVTGKTDIITDGRYILKIENQSDILAYITGTGCMITSLIASFLGAGNTPFISATAGIMAMSISGEKALERENREKNGIASYKIDVMNNIYHFSPELVKEYAKISIEKIDCKFSMYLITDEKTCMGKDLYECVEESIKGGAKIVQLREKNLGTREFLERASKIKEICKKYGATMLINDRIDIALAVDADGVHLGQSDMPIEIAKKLIGYNKIIGISAGNIKEAKEAEKKGADYIGVGAIFSTSTKKDADAIEKETLKNIADEVSIPVLAIGGICVENMEYLKGTNIDGICVISDILKNDDCKKRTQELVNKFNQIK